MTYSITDRHRLLNSDLRELAERRMLFALSRFDDRINRVDLVISDENGPRGGVDKACRIMVSLKGGADVIVRDKDADMATCLSNVAERTGRAVSRALSKRQSFDRSRPEFRDPVLQRVGSPNTKGVSWPAE